MFKYVKIGKGRLWHCWKNRIVEDLSVHDEEEIRCRCGNLLGFDEGKWIKLKQNAFQCIGR
jgi:hypothetical protein